MEARDYFKELHHEELGESFTYPGPFIKDMQGGRLGLRRQPPLIGQHNDEIYQGELGLTAEEVASLQSEGII